MSQQINVMAHNIHKRDRQQGRKQAWHNLTDVRECLTLDDNFLTEWEIRKEGLFLPNGIETDFSILTATDDNEVIGTPFAVTYKPVSNRMFLDMIKDAIKDVDGTVVESIGSVRNRGRVFVSISLKGHSEYTIGRRTFKDYLNFGNAHDQSSSLWVNTTNICTVCDNTFTYNFNTTGTGISMKAAHKGDIELKINNIVDVVDRHLGAQAKYKAQFEKLVNEPIDQADALCLFAGWSNRNKDKNDTITNKSLDKVNRIFWLFNNGQGNLGQSRADAFSAVTDYFTHESTRGGGEDVRAQFVSSEFGTGRDAKINFWDVINDDNKVFEYVESGNRLLVDAFKQ